MKRIVEYNKVSNFLEYGIDVDNFEIKLFDEIDENSSSNFVWGLHLLASNSRDRQTYKPIIVHLSTPGGDVCHGMAIFDAIKSIPNQVYIVAYGEVCSMGSQILQAGHRRVMMPHSALMFHTGSTALEGTPKKVNSQIQYENACEDVMYEIYASQMKKNGTHSKKSKLKIKEWLKSEMDKKEDVYLTAKQTVDLGLADEVFTSWRSIRK